MIEAANTVKPALGSFYGSLTTEQKARFNRLGRERSAIPGTGLGLVVVKQLVEAMGGSIRVDSQPGEGTCVTLDLPFAPA